MATVYLEQDPYAEGVMRKLMAYHAQTGNNLMVSRLYKNFQKAIKVELDCGVSDKTRDLYRRLVSNA
jgi:DNA-binding SARP family transcriptional activator